MKIGPQDPPKTELAGAGGRVLLDFGPLLVFIVTYWLSDVYTATATFMAATLAAIIWSRVRHKAVSPMLLFSGAMVLVFGGATIWLHDETFIKIKPTLYYAMIAAILFGGLLTRRPTLKAVMGAAYPELSDSGWHLLSRNFAWFFVVMAIANELVWRNSSTGFWLGYKLWGALPATILFGMVNVPMILRHSKEADAAPDVQ